LSDSKQSISGARAPDSQRIDKWLWCARFFKTRSLASKFVSTSQMRLTRDQNTSRIEKPSFMIRAGDELAFSIGERLKIILVEACGVRRGPASEAQTLYTDHTPPPPPRAEKPTPIFEREKGAGRPTKKDRRDMDRLKQP